MEATGFRNLSGSLTGAPGLNFLWGQNGQGKTSWLEALYLLGSTKSFRTHYLGEAITFHNQAAHLKAYVEDGSRRHTLEIHLEGSQKHLFVNGKRVGVSEYLGHLDAFVYCQEEMCIVRGEPSERRRFLDRGVVSLRPAYVQTLADYNRTVKQKNALLKSVRESETLPVSVNDMLEVWNRQLVEYGTAVHQARVRYVERLNQVLERQFFGVETVTVRYRSSLEEHGDISRYPELFTHRLQIRREAETTAGHALVGPHRDDLEIRVDGHEVARFGSAGQQRSALLILELARLSIYNEELLHYPVFLIDDIDAELDRTRIDTLLEYLDGKAQVFVTTSKAALAADYHHLACLNQIINGAAAGVDRLPDQA